MANAFPVDNGPYGVVGAVPIYTDSKATVPAVVLDINGNPLPGGAVNVPSNGIWPSFTHATAKVLYFKKDDGTIQPLYPYTVISPPTVTGSKGANAALTSLCSALAAQGLIVDSTS